LNFLAQAPTMALMNLTHQHIVPATAWSVTAADACSWPQRSGTAADEQAAWSVMVAAAEDLLTEDGLPDVRLVLGGDLVGTYSPGRDAAGQLDPDAVRAGLRDMQAAADPDAEPLAWLG
jgi:hypothetical protein